MSCADSGILLNSTVTGVTFASKKYKAKIFLVYQTWLARVAWLFENM